MRYFNAWRWYPLDYERIVDFTKQQRLILVQNSNSIVEGLAIVDKTGGWANADILQLVYLDASSIFIYIMKLIKTGTRRRKIQQEWHRAMILMMFGIT